MAKIELNSLVESIRGKIGKAVLRRSHTGELQFIKSPDMSKVKWSKAQEEHRVRFAEAVFYAKTAMDDPELHAFYLEMAARVKKNKRPFDMAVSDYFQGNNRLPEFLALRSRPGLPPALSREGQPDYSI